MTATDLSSIGGRVGFSNSLSSLIEKSTGIPVSIGLGPNKTLAKVANYIVKKDISIQVSSINKDNLDRTLKRVPIDKVWGVGRSSSSMLSRYGVRTAYDFASLRSKWVGSLMSISALRTMKELRGERCYVLSCLPSPKVSIRTARSLVDKTSDITVLEGLVSSYATNCAEKLRAQRGCAKRVTVFLGTDNFSNEASYRDSRALFFNSPSSDGIEISRLAIRALHSIFKKEYIYKKVGVIVSDIVPSDSIQINMFDTADRTRRDRLMRSIDIINRSKGSGTVRIATNPYSKPKSVQKNLSPCYTTRWEDLLIVR